MMDTITISRLKVRCIIGCNPDERVKEQDLFITVEMQTDTIKAGSSDNLDDTVNYSAVAKAVAAIAINGQFKLIEALAHNIAEHCLKDKRINSVTVTIEKPAAIKMADAATIRIIRP
jgi:FolB domain-containing protein